ncbi:MAG: hypothetical protein V1813_00215, partial [Candidatus Aenigmatarchaeota archaeon]
MKKIMVYLQLIAAFCAVLILSIPVTSAMSIRVFMPGSQSPEQETSYDVPSKIEKSVSVEHEQNDVRWENVWVKLSVIGKDLDYEITKIYLYLCKDKGPAECSSGMPIEAGNYLSGEKASFKWGNDISAKGVANFMTLVEMKHGSKTIWVGFFDTIERKDTVTFNVVERNLENIDVYAKSAVNSLWVKNYIDEYMMAPAEWIDKAVLGGKDAFYTLSANKTGLDLAKLSSSSTAGSEVSAFSKEYTFIFGKDVTAYPFTFFLAPPVSCQDTQCDLILGETPSNCCLDCGCPLESQDCTTNVGNPDGLCHTCGDEIKDVVENSTNCCADIGCTDGRYCDLTIKPPYGKCVNANCGQKGCEETENSANCAKDCYATLRKRCNESYGDNSYYYSPSLKDCVKAECGNDACEPLGGETFEVCCMDSATSDSCQCPAGNYCNTETDEAGGTCMPSNCDNEKCEFDEARGKANACCLDCDDCASGMTCDDNVCHDCGNGNVEGGLDGPETETTCCHDTGCSTSGDYCGESGSCRHSSMMHMNVMLSPSAPADSSLAYADCNQEDPAASIKAIISLADRPEKFGKFTSASYEIKDTGVQKQMSCTESSVYYECSIPLTGSDIFPGCFGAVEEKDVEITASFTYYPNVTSKSTATASLSEDVTIDVKNARDKTCIPDGECDASYDENQGNCCYDCGCPSDGFCVAGTCSAASSITIDAHDAEGIPDCRTGTDKVTFSANVVAKPDSGDEEFSFKPRSYLVNYNYVKDGVTVKRTGTATNLTGLECTSEETLDSDVLTGKIDCVIPISVFPLCQYGTGEMGSEQQAQMELSVAVFGGGLKDEYSNGLRVSDTFNVKYKKGLPKCDGESECLVEDGETETTCCKDCGCADSASTCADATESSPCTESGYAKRFCSADTGACDDEGNIKLILKMDESELDCSDPDEFVTFTASLASVPIGLESPAFSDMKLHVTWTDASGNPASYDSYPGYTGSTAVCEEGDGKHEINCKIKMSSFNPCWDTGEKTATLSATVSYDEKIDEEERDVDLASGPVSFSVVTAMGRPCNQKSGCQTGIGELMDVCCTDCGCSLDADGTSERVCARLFEGTAKYGCEKKSDVTMTITDYSEEVDCSGSGSNNDLLIELTIDNVPYNNEGIEWYVTMDKDRDGTPETYDVLDCEDGGAGYENTYTCETSTAEFPELCYHVCPAGGCLGVIPDKEWDITLNGTIYHFEPSGGEPIGDIAISAPMHVKAVDLLPSCSTYGGSRVCEAGYGETSDTCCADCRCPGGKVCTVNGCKAEAEITLTITPNPKTLSCTQTIAKYNQDNFKPELYECKFVDTDDSRRLAADLRDDLFLNVKIENMPVNLDIGNILSADQPDVYYLMSGSTTKYRDVVLEKDGAQLKLRIMPKSLTGEVKEVENLQNMKMEIHINMFAKDNSVAGSGGKMLELSRTIALKINRIEDEDLTSADENLKKIRNTIYYGILPMATVTAALGLCQGCSPADPKKAGISALLTTELAAIAIGAFALYKVLGKGETTWTTIGILGGAYAMGLATGIIIRAIPPTPATPVNPCVPILVAIDAPTTAAAILTGLILGILLLHISNL